MLDAGGVLVGANTAANRLLGDLGASVGEDAVSALDIRTVTGERADPSVPPRSDEVEWQFGVEAGDVAVTVTRAAAPDGGVILCLRPVGDRSGIGIVSTVSHELRSPLTSVKGYVSLMLSRWERIDDDRKREMLEHVHHDADRVTRLVTELLDISRLETGRLVLRRQLVDLGALASSVVEKVAMAYPGLECAVELPDLPAVYADPDKLEQVLTNLVENAAKYGDPHGMRITGGADDDAVSVSVTDIGEGIPTEDLPRVFTKFFRRDHGKPSGTGLGLWISRGLVEAHGGELTATSDEGSGATFTFTLPVRAFEALHGED